MLHADYNFTKNKSALVPMVTWCQTVDELFSEPTMGKYRATYMRH